MQIRLAKNSDLDAIQKTYKVAKEFMVKSGNPTQWPQGYPHKDMLVSDIEKNQLFVLEENSEIHGVFAFIIGIDPTYIYIENGAWLDNSAYGAIHRIASNGKTKGVFEMIVNFCKEKIPHLRIDTHENNKVMQHLVQKYGFKKCGTIFVLNKSPRIAYEYLP